MRKATDVEISRRRLRALTLIALRYMIYTEGWTQADVGRAIGYKDGTMVGRVMRLPEHPRYTMLLGAAETFALSELASMHGFDVMADAASGAGKHTVPTPENLPGGCAIDGDFVPELLLVQETAGLFSAERGPAGDELARDQHSRRLLGAAGALFRDAQLELRGDSMPERATLVQASMPS